MIQTLVLAFDGRLEKHYNMCHNYGHNYGDASYCHIVGHDSSKDVIWKHTPLPDDISQPQMY